MAKLTEITEAESATRLENQSLKATIAEHDNVSSKLRNENRLLTQKVTQYTAITDLNMLQGRWEVKATASSFEVSMVWKIEGNLLVETEGMDRRSFAVKDILFDKPSLKIALILEGINELKPIKTEVHVFVTDNETSRITLTHSSVFKALTAVRVS